ncbi:olfactory receptor 52E4-like [Engraulis encrasicolus]|uniref:olfactory receptor 52E4-like n=1 Tax=Engraulis encrasicolus TaxID=184585 RepID=UPI002FCF2373
MDNVTNVSYIVTLQGFNVPQERAFTAFLLAILGYMIIAFCNLLLLLSVFLNRALHQPMYILLINLPINDLIGSSALFCQLFRVCFTRSKVIEFPACVTQAFFIHIYATGAGFTLAMMAYDRYIAICKPLQYASIMTNAHLMSLIALVWGFSVLIIGVLFILLLRLPRCRNNVTHTYCDNPSLLKLMCGDTTINNIYGLIATFTQPLIVAVILYTYLQILITCFRSKSTDTRAKAMQTCATHLVVFLLFECLGLFTIISYRLKHLSTLLTNFICASALIFPPTLNPIIYGINSKEIRNRFIKSFKKHVLPK